MIEDNFDNGEDCPIASTILPLLIMNKPFGMSWPLEKVEWFLKKRGYIIIEREDPEEGLFKVAVHEGDDYIPMESNLIKTFSSELQDIILNKLLEN